MVPKDLKIHHGPPQEEPADGSFMFLSLLSWPLLEICGSTSEEPDWTQDGCGKFEMGLFSFLLFWKLIKKKSTERYFNIWVWRTSLLTHEQHTSDTHEREVCIYSPCVRLLQLFSDSPKLWCVCVCGPFAVLGCQSVLFLISVLLPWTGEVGIIPVWCLW